MKYRSAFALIALAVSSMSWAGGSIQIAYIPQVDLEIDSVSGSGSDSGDGHSLKGRVDFGENFFMYGRVINREIDAGFDLDHSGIGIGWKRQSGTQLVWVGLNAEKLEVSSSAGSADTSGIAFRAGMTFAFENAVQIYGEIASSVFEDQGVDTSGAEFMIGSLVPISENFGLFADYRLHLYEDEVNSAKVAESDMSDLQIGLALSF